MVTSAPAGSLADIAREAAASPELQEYLALRGVKTPATLALLSKTEDDLEKILIQPLMAGWTKADGSSITLSDAEKPIAKAVLTHMWMVSRHQLQASQVSTPPVPPTTSTAASSTPAATEDKVPKTLAPGKWTSMLQHYQSQQIGGEDRIFPTHELLGSEGTLARIVHENEVTKSFTPVQLGEIMATRTFLPTGEPNPLSKKERSSQKLQLSGEGLIAEKEEQWQPRSLLAVMDGLNSVRWAFILCQIGSEQAVHTFFDWFIRLARSRPQKTEQMGQFYLSTAWRLAMEMRSGKTFNEVVPTLMKDFDSFSECMAREPTLTKRPASASRQGESKGPGKGNSKSKSPRPGPYNQPNVSTRKQHV